MKVVYNSCFGGFSLSHKGIMRYAELKGIKLYPFVGSGKMKLATDADIKDAFCIHYCTTPEYSNDTYWSDREIDRSDSALVQAVEELGESANGSCADLAIRDVKCGALWRIDEYDGNEQVVLQDEYDWNVAT